MFTGGGVNRPCSASEMLSNLNISTTVGGRDSAFSASPAFAQQALQPKGSVQPSIPAFNYADLNIFTQSGFLDFI